MVGRERLEERAQCSRVENPRGRELPQYRPKFLAQFGDAGVEEALDRFLCLGEVTAVGRVARPFDGEDEVCWGLLAPQRKLSGFCDP